MKTKQDYLNELCNMLETTDETVNLFELLERFYNEAYNQGWADCYWKTLKRQGYGMDKNNTREL